MGLGTRPFIGKFGVDSAGRRNWSMRGRFSRIARVKLREKTMSYLLAPLLLLFLFFAWPFVLPWAIYLRTADNLSATDRSYVSLLCLAAIAAEIAATWLLAGKHLWHQTSSGISSKPMVDVLYLLSFLELCHSRSIFFQIRRARAFLPPSIAALSRRVLCGVL